MRMDPIHPGSGPLITAYGGGGFSISGQSYQGSILVGMKGIEPFPVTEISDLTIQSLSSVLVEKPEILLIGCGMSMVPLSPQIQIALSKMGIKVEAMSTAAACRTHAIISSDGRRVMAALIAVE